MLRSVLIVLLLGFALCGFGQSSVPRLRELGNEHFDATQYIEATKFFEKVVELDKKDYESYYKLGMSYYKTLNYEGAKKHFSKLINIQNNEYADLSTYHYGNILKLQSYFKTASEIFALLLSKSNVDDVLLELARKQLEGCELAISNKKNSRGYSIEEMENLNSPFHDFGATINPNNGALVIVSTRNLHDNQYGAIQYGGLLPDLIQFTEKNRRWANTSSKNRFNRLNSEWAEGSGSFTADGKSFFFTSCRSQDGADCKIMVSHLINDKWGDPIALNKYINLDSAENKQPSISPTGDTLFFVSNRPGGFGGSDIWMSLKGDGDDSWTPAINLGDVINTSSNEITPYYSAAFECLMFSSNGHVGYGGHDIFAAKGESFFEPELYNLGAPFNSPLDDTYFSIGNGRGFISSNRKDHENLNLYTFNVSNERLYLSLLISGETLLDEKIVARYRNIRALDLVTFRIEDNEGFEVFDPVKTEISKTNILEEVILDKKPATTPTEEELIASNETVNDVDLVVSSGSKAQSLTNAFLGNDGAADLSYSSDTNYGDESLQDKERDYNPIRINREVTRRRSGRTNGLMVIEELPENVKNLPKLDYEKLYFRFGSAKLSPGSKSALISLISQLKNNESLVEHLQITTYTDEIGTDKYNLWLSQARGMAIKQFLESNGVSSQRITVTAIGEGNQVARGDEWYHHQFNRRAEISVFSQRPIKIEKSELVVLRQGMSFEDAADKLGVSLSKLKALNKIDNEFLERGQVLRVGEDFGTADLNYFLDETDVKFNFFSYKISEGETLSSIAEKFRTPEELLLELNKIEGQLELETGDEIFVYNLNF